MTMDIPDTFNGGIFSDNFEGGRRGATIRIAPEGVVATVADGREYRIRFGECHIEMGGTSGRMLFCRTADRSLTIFCDDRRFGSELRRGAGGLLDEPLAACSRRQRRDRARGLMAGVLFVAALAILLTAGFLGLRLAADASIDAVPLAVDNQIGEQAFRMMDRGGVEVHDPVITAAVQQIVDRLSPHAGVAGLDFTVHVIDADTCNAFCLPGGRVVLYTGLLRRSASADEVAGVLAHEMAHATLRHGLRQVIQSVGLAAAVNVLVGNMEGLVVAGAEVFKLATINGYSRTQEADADAEAVRMLHAANLDPMSLARFFETLQRDGGDIPAALTWLSTHPDHAARIAAVRNQIGTLSPAEYVPLDIDWEQVRLKATRD